MKGQYMDLGAFSISLAVKDIQASYEFYSKLGFQQFGGDIDEKWIILKNGDHLIGLFEGMFEDNILTFNPGWNQEAQNLDSFTDVRELYKALQAKGLSMEEDMDTEGSGPASFVIKDPDGNPILIDQHR